MNNRIPSRSRPLTIGTTLLTASLLAACASTPPNSNLEAARQDYAQAAATPAVAAAAPRELTLAQDELRRGDAAFQDKQKPEVVDHYAYLARQRVQVALEAAQVARADQAARDAQQQRDRIVLESRTQQAEQAQLSAALANQRAADAAQRAAAANQRADALADQLAEAKQTDRGMVLTLGDVLFDTGRASLKPGAQRVIDEVATFLAQHPERKVLIEGYTDSTGSEATNQDLSERRAASVRDALMRQNVAFDRIQVHGLGERYPVASNDTSGGRQQNRRVEVVFSTPAGTFQSPRS